MNEEWINATDRLPSDGDYITAEIEYMGKRSKVAGKATSGGHCLFDFYSGTGAAPIIRWKPRTPPRTDGHSWTAIERGTA